MIVELPFIGPDHQSASKIISGQESLNVYPEINPESTRPVAFLGRPGRELFSSIGGTPQAFWEMGDAAYAIVSNVVYRIGSSGVPTALSTTVSGSRLGVAHNGTTALVSSGNGDWSVTSAAVTSVTDPDIPTGKQSTYHNGYWLKSVAGTNEFQASAIDDSTAWDPNDNAFERQVPGTVVAVLSDHAELLLMKSKAIGFWFESGAASGIPFDKIPQLILETGVIAPDSVLGKLDERVFFLGQSENSTPMVFVLEGRNVRRISSNAVEHQIAKYANPENAYAMQFAFEGHPFYVLTFPGVYTHVYDVSTSAWHRWKTHGREDYDGTHSVRAYNKTLVMANDGNIYQLKETLYQDAGADFVRQRVAAPMEAEGKNFQIDSVELECEVGEAPLGVTPVVSLEISRDGGTAWSNKRSKSLGATGQRLHRVRWTGLGAARDAVPRISMTGNVKTVWRALRADIRVGFN